MIGQPEKDAWRDAYDRRSKGPAIYRRGLKRPEVGESCAPHARAIVCGPGAGGRPQTGPSTFAPNSALTPPQTFASDGNDRITTTGDAAWAVRKRGGGTRRHFAGI